MKYISYFPALFAAALMSIGCTDETLVGENASSGEDINIEQFSEGYSLAFDMGVSSFGDNNGAKTRADDTEDGISDADIEEWENYIDPQEFRILFFDSQDRFLFESKSRWLTQIPTHDGGRRWRVGVPVFQYLSDGFDEHVSEYESSWVMDDAYNWDRIAEIMRTEPFKVAILANRQSDIKLRSVSDLSEDQMKVATFGKNGPFWGPKNSRAYYDVPENEEAKKMIKTVFDLHHCQYDPYYENKNANEGSAYSFIMEMGPEYDIDGNLMNVPHMGAVSSWLHSEREKSYSYEQDGKSVTGTRYYFKLPKGRYLTYSKDDKGNVIEKDDKSKIDEDQYIPMYGLQQFEPLKNWKKGTTYYLSDQSGSQTAEYDYKYIYLLRSVVKLEVRIPMFENEKEVYVDNEWAHICGCNIMARSEPMDIWSPTEEIWKSDHQNDCEWISIRDYGLYADGTTDYKGKLSWFFGIWDKEKKWDFGGQKVAPEIKNNVSVPYPRVFNPITQRLQRAMITDCYLPIKVKDSKGELIRSQCYHRWIVYCGERNMNDPNTLNNLSTTGYIATFRIAVTRPTNKTQVIYNLPITDYRSDNPIKNYLKETPDNGGDVKNNKHITKLGSYPSYLERGDDETSTENNGYYDLVKKTKKENYPYPLLRNHHYRLTLNFTNGNDVDVEVLSGDRRVVGGIEFN